MRNLLLSTQIKNSVAHQMIKQACELFPQMEDKIDLIEIDASHVDLWRVTSVIRLGPPMALAQGN